MASSPHKPIAILGAGSWGTALALYLARLDQPVNLWTHEPAHAQQMQAARANKQFLPQHPFPASIQVFEDIDAAVNNVEDILIVVPSIGFRETLNKIQPALTPNTRVGWGTKGLDPTTGKLLHEVAKEVLGNSVACGVISGPSFAREVAAGLPTALVVATENKNLSAEWIKRFNSPLLRVYSSNDITGVEIGGVVKNVLAIATGISDGMKMGANARAALITRGVAEMMRLGVSLGGKKETFMGLTGLGDLILTATDDQSRNRRFGLGLGQGKTAAEVEKEIGQVIEGKQNTESLVKLAKKQKVEMPIVEAVWKLLQNQITLKEALQSLLTRAPKEE